MISILITALQASAAAAGQVMPKSEIKPITWRDRLFDTFTAAILVLELALVVLFVVGCVAIGLLLRSVA